MGRYWEEGVYGGERKGEKDGFRQVLKGKALVPDTEIFAYSQYVSGREHVFWSSVCISRSLYLSQSLATYVRLSLELVCLLDALQRYLKNFPVKHALPDVSCAHTGGDITEGDEDPALCSAAQRPAIDTAFQCCFHQVFLSQFIYFWIPLNSKQK